MIDNDDFDDDERRRAAIIRRARVEGIEVAYETALAVCRDAKAPAQAKASAQRTLMQIGGLLDRSDRQAEQDKSPAEMTSEELNRAVARLKRSRSSADGDPGSVFD
ncbi:hypothetical protein [Mesorhizobium sp. B2-3-4]|uniref:hypothetical protein n=1 Tax=Mesorhizobium sp. B2-3-4 TaxID=2589959 RepID=UPI0011298E62|nr:hypothetical protein [Mesorhizobium sp. B2-3-4]TPM31457.1 hypothetical protein FJ967_24770 [Mesorhizobium sp. B2-3-4]